MKIAFFWTWEFSKNILSWILKKTNTEVCLVVSQPDKPVWRKKEILPTPIKTLAINSNIEVSQPARLKPSAQPSTPGHSLLTKANSPSPSREKVQEQINNFYKKLKSLNLDFIVVVAYWKIIPKEILEIPKYWCINIHWSILPKYRWASPIQEALKNWDKTTWLTIMYMSEWMDEWEILKIQEVKIDIIDKTPDIFEKFENIWVDLLYHTLVSIVNNKISWIKQDEFAATYCSKILKQEGEIIFKDNSAETIYNKFRSFYPWPGIYSFYKNKKISFEDCFFSNQETSKLNIWDVMALENKNIWIVCKSWILILYKVKLEWKKTMDINIFINWNKDFLNYNFD